MIEGLPCRIRTERLLLRSWQPADAALLKDAIDSSLPELQRSMPWAKTEPSSIDAIQERLALFAAAFSEGREWIYGVFAPDEELALGSCGVHRRAGSDGLEIGYWIRTSHTGIGYATEAASAATSAALATAGVDFVQIKCDARNQRSASVARRLAYRLVQTIHDDPVGIDGALRDTLVWQLERHTSQARQPEPSLPGAHVTEPRSPTND